MLWLRAVTIYLSMLGLLIYPINHSYASNVSQGIEFPPIADDSNFLPPSEIREGSCADILQSFYRKMKSNDNERIEYINEVQTIDYSQENSESQEYINAEFDKMKSDLSENSDHEMVTQKIKKDENLAEKLEHVNEREDFLNFIYGGIGAVLGYYIMNQGLRALTAEGKSLRERLNLKGRVSVLSFLYFAIIVSEWIALDQVLKTYSNYKESVHLKCFGSENNNNQTSHSFKVYHDINSIKENAIDTVGVIYKTYVGLYALVFALSVALGTYYYSNVEVQKAKSRPGHKLSKRDGPNKLQQTHRIMETVGLLSVGLQSLILMSLHIKEITKTDDQKRDTRKLKMAVYKNCLNMINEDEDCSYLKEEQEAENESSQTTTMVAP